MLEQFRELAPDRIVFTGDLVHSKNTVSPELIEFVSWILTECAKITKTIVIIGNHDMIESNLDRLDTLTPIINSLNNPNICYYKDRGVYEDENVNWCVYSLVQHNIPPEILQNDKFNIGLFHGPVQGLTTDIGYKFETGFGIYNLESDEYSFVDLDNPKPFLSFKMKSFDDIINGTEKLVNGGN
jgi:DNA repair exonuclease SbcCD nuclease subunit